MKTVGWSIPNQAGILDVFSCNRYWIEEICGTPAKALALMRLGRRSAEREGISEIDWNAF
ncbi:hypothetical protein [Peribacillus frigoritolerans]